MSFCLKFTLDVQLHCTQHSVQVPCTVCTQLLAIKHTEITIVNDQVKV